MRNIKNIDEYFIAKVNSGAPYGKMVKDMTECEIRFGARIDKIAITSDKYGEPDIGAIHIAYSEYGFVGHIENYGTILFPNIDEFFYRIDKTAHFKPCDALITIRRNCGKNHNPMVNANFYIICEVIDHEKH